MQATEESSIHLFLDCPFARVLWVVVGEMFGFPVPRGTGYLVNMFEACCAISYSTEIRLLWITVVISIFWII